MVFRKRTARRMGMKRPRKFKRSVAKRSTVIKKIATAAVKKELRKVVEQKIGLPFSSEVTKEGQFNQIQVGLNMARGIAPNERIGDQVFLKGLRIRWSAAYTQANATGSDDSVQVHMYVVQNHSAISPINQWFLASDTDDSVPWSSYTGVGRLNAPLNVRKKGDSMGENFTILAHKKLRQGNSQNAQMTRYKTGVWYVRLNKRMVWKTFDGVIGSAFDIQPYIWVIGFAVSELSGRVTGILDHSLNFIVNPYYTDL